MSKPVALFTQNHSRQAKQANYFLLSLTRGFGHTKIMQAESNTK